jgi:deoxyribodipyrimidine photolyase-like uncharacterized protein
MSKRETYYQDSKRRIDIIRDDDKPAKARWTAVNFNARGERTAQCTASTRRSALTGLKDPKNKIQPF